MVGRMHTVLELHVGLLKRRAGGLRNPQMSRRERMGSLHDLTTMYMPQAPLALSALHRGFVNGTDVVS